MSRDFNSTFLNLIPNKNKPKDFNDYRPIALCNIAYKIITKIIGKRLKPILSENMTKEQFGFLGNRKIMDVVGVTQEILHSIKPKNLFFLILNMDLVKSYEEVIWTFLRLLLLQIGIPISVTN